MHSPLWSLGDTADESNTPVQSPKLDKRLFRSPPPATRLEPGNTVAFHPALDRTNLVCTSLSDAYVFVPKPVTDYSCVNDYATSPACTTLSLMMGSNPIVRNPLGVTVLDVIKRCVKMWTSKPPLERALQVVEWEEEARVEEVTWRDTLGDHCFWEGMESAKVAKQDWVRLYPKWFGS